MTKSDYINMEYEARVMVSKEQYNAILSYYSKSRKPKSFIINENTYFDYEDLYLTEHHMVLRTRLISDSKYELTLKIKGENGDIELNYNLKIEEYENLIHNMVIPNSVVLDKLKELNIDLNKLKLITTLKTDRLEIEYSKFLLVIDKNYYRGRVDYNIEVESYSKTAAKRYLNEKLERFGVQYKNGYISKSRRAIYNL